MEFEKEVKGFMEFFEDYRKDEQSYYENMIKKVNEQIEELKGEDNGRKN